MIKQIIALSMTMAMLATGTSGCDEEERREDTNRTISIANELQSNQPTPTDIV